VAAYDYFESFNQQLETAMSNAMSKTSDVNESKTFTRTAPPAWLLDFWKEIDDKTWGKGFGGAARRFARVFRSSSIRSIRVSPPFTK
jgi:hypothetical protein